MKRIDEIWMRMVAAARQVPPHRDDAMPVGFSTRVVAQAFTQARASEFLLERLAMRMMGVSCLIALFALLTYFSVGPASATLSETDAIFQLEDPASLFIGDISDE